MVATKTLQKTFTALVQKIEKGRENFLTAPTNLTQGLADTLAKWEEERVSLENEIKTAQASGDDNIKEWLRQQAAWWNEIKGKLTWVKTGESVAVKNYWIGKTTVKVEVPMKAATLRELLHKLNAKVWLWFIPRRDGKKGWEIDRGRFKAVVGEEVYYDGPFHGAACPLDRFPSPAALSCPCPGWPLADTARNSDTAPTPSPQPLSAWPSASCPRPCGPALLPPDFDGRNRGCWADIRASGV